MGRKQSNTVDYFPHFAEPGKTVFILKSRFGNNGYAFWFQLLEVLCKEENHFYDCRGEAEWQYLLARTGVNEETGREMLNILATLGKIDKVLWQKKIIWCGKLVINLAEVYKKRERLPPGKPSVANLTVSDTETPISGTETGVSGAEIPQSRVEYSKVNGVLPPKGGPRKTRPTNNKRDATVKEIFLEMQEYFGFPEKIKVDPIPSYGKEGQAVKRMLARGFTRKAIVQCWKGKVSQRGGEFVSMTWVNQDIGQTGKRSAGIKKLSSEEEIAASIKEREQ
jgi:hypothetical protein